VIQGAEGDVEIRAQAIISDLGPKKTIEITGAEHFDRAYLAEVKQIRPTPPIVIANVVSDEPLIPHQGLVWPIGASRLICILSPTLCCPELAPAGKHLLQSYSGVMTPQGAMDMNREIEANLEELYGLIPDARTKGRVLSVGCWQGEWPLFRTVWHGLPQKTPVINLYNVGDGVRIPGMIGVTLCAETARVVVEDLMNRFAPSS
jgi:phytoene dehydrogenase-like protein